MKKSIYFSFLHLIGFLIAITITSNVIGQIQVDDSLTNPNCISNCNGSITLEVTNAVLPVSYLWSTGDTTSDLDNLCADSYEVTIHDATYSPVPCPWTFLNTGVNASCLFNQASILINNQTIIQGDVLGVFFESSGNLYCAGYSTINGLGLNAIAIWGDDISTPAKDGFAVGDTIKYALWRSGVGDTVILTPTAYTYGNPLPWVYGNNSTYVLDSLTGNAIPGSFNPPVYLEFDLFLQNNLIITSNLSSYGPYQISSNGGNNGYIQLSATGGNTPYYWLWSTGDTLPDISNLTAGVYDITLTDSGGCEIVETFTLTEPWAIQVSATLSNYNGFNTTYGNSDGSIQLSIIGGIPPYIIQWSNGFTGTHLTNISAGIYEVTITDQFSNYTTASFSLTEQVILPFSFVSSSISSYSNGYNVTAYGASNGSITVLFTNGLPPYQYVWSNGSTNQQISNLPAGLYSLTCSDQGETTIIKHFEILEPPYTPIYRIEAGKSTYNQLNISSPGGNDGYIIPSVFGGNQPLTYSWSNGSSTMIINNLYAGTYTVTVTDGISSISDSFTLIDSLQLPPISSSFSEQNQSCFNECDGEINVSLVGGNPPYYITWNDGTSDTSKTNLCAGTYTVCMTDSAHAIINMPWHFVSNIFNSQFILIPDSSILINGNLPDPGDKIGVFSLFDGIFYCQGYATLDGNNIALNANYTNILTSNEGFHNSDSIYWKLWRISDGTEIWLSPTYENNFNGLFIQNTVETIQSLTGNYNPASITPSSNSIYLSFTLTEPAPIESYAIILQEDTLLNIPGSISTYTFGGTPPYEFNWSNGDTTANINGLSAGNYSLTITDANLCDTIFNWTLSTVPVPPLNLVNTSTGVSCFGACDGMISILINSGTPPYQITWSDGSTSSNLSGLCPGSYELTVSDLAYSQIHSFIVSEPSPIQLDTIIELVDPLIGNNGSIDLNISGGTPPFTFEWSNGSSSEVITGLTVGLYSLTIQDNNNCQQIHQFTLTNSYTIPPLNIQSNASQPICYAACTGSIDLAVSGGVPPYTYQWAGGETSSSLTNLCAGIYDVTVSSVDTTLYLQIELFSPLELNLGITTTDIEPSSGTPGNFELNISGGILPYSYEWSTGATTQNVTIPQPGTYTITVHDANGCTISTSASIEIINFPWEVTQNQQFHKIIIPSTASIQFDGNSPDGYDAFGVFYTVNGAEICGGFLLNNSNSDTLLAYGNNPSTSNIDGFQTNEDFVWKIWDASTDSIYEVAAFYDNAYPQTGQFTHNGLSRIDSLEYTSLSGYVSTYSKSPLQSGKLLLIRIENNRYQTILVKDIEDGYFRIAGIYPGDYLIYAIPNPKDEIGIPTYFVNHLEWETANIISVAGHTGGINLTLKPIVPINSGQGTIQGIVLNDSSDLYNPVLFESDWFPGTKLANNVARNVPVLLYNQQHEPAWFTLSDQYGMYSFPNLAYGTYYVGAELAGLNSDSVEVVLDGSNPIANINFTIHDQSVIGIEDILLNNYLIIYPNPTSKELYIQANYPFSNICIKSLDGKSCEFNTIAQQPDLLKIDISNLPAGIYLIETITPTMTKSSKFVKME